MMSHVTRYTSRVTRLLLCFLFLSAAGCGYTTRSMISDKFKTIYIAQFTNKIDITKDTDVAAKYKVYRPLLETDVTKAVANKYLADGNLRPAKETADLTLKGELTGFQRDAVRYTENNDVEEYRINITVNLSLWDNRENKLAWEEHGFTGEATYFTTGSLSISEDAAVENAIKDLARRIVERTVEQW